MGMKKIKILFLIFIIFFVIFFVISTVVFSNLAQDQKTQNSSLSTPTHQSILNTEIPRNLLIELFINANCTACPKAAFCLEELIWSYEPGRVILVEAHIWNDGYDIPQTNARYDWYTGSGKKGTPDTYFNGLSERILGLCCDCGDIDDNIAAYQEIIERQLNRTSPLEIQAIMEIYGGKIIIEGNFTNRGHSLLSDLIISGMIYYEGDESELFYLVKDIFIEQDICQLEPLGERKFSFVSSLDLSELEESELNRFYGVVFVQDKLTKEVLQSFLIQ